MQNLTLRKATSILMLSSALLTGPALGAEFKVTGPSTERNGGAANVLDGNDSLTIEAGGSLTQNTAASAVNGTGNSNTVINAGSISISGPSLVGILLTDSNTVTNTGTITTDTLFSTAIFVRDNSTVVSSGTILTNSDNSNGILGRTNNKLTNSGTITVTSDTSAAMGGLNANTITNSGTINVSGTNSVGATALGANNIFTNSGTITVNGMNGFGMSAPSNTNTLNNTGTIITNGIGGAGMGSAGGDLLTITNSGTITTNGNAHGIIVVNDSNVDNSGTIETFGPDGRGIFAGIGNIVTQSGKIVAAKSAAIEFTGTDNQLILNAPAFIGGAIEMSNFNVVEITTGRSQSNRWKLNGNPANVAVSGPVPWAWDATTNEFASLDPTALLAAPDVLADLTGSLSDISRDKTESNAWWLQGYGSFSSQPAQTIYNDYTHLSGGVAAGAAYVLNDNFAVGAMVGYQASSLSVNSKWITSQTIVGQGIVGGVYASASFDSFFADFALYGGWSKNSSDRFVNDNLAALGQDHAFGAFNSWFLAPELRLGADFEAGDGWVITPSTTIRYATQSQDAYTETGSNANATISANNVKIFEGNAELAITHDADNFSVTVRGGVNYRKNLGGTTRDIVLLGQTLTMPVLANTTISPYVGLDAALNINETMALDISGKATYLGTDAYAVSASVGLSSQF